ncbi:unnamed protein product [Dovyalis caffra]|uniref:Uncharacterized protein n=1 Tax=Dovyalis caffra TaxID=77055 RepID=A0AAV1QUU5_9ROSI|nr:unnamed protein product [Dovyalis caffra]
MHAAALTDDETFMELNGSQSGRKTSISVHTLDILSVNELLDSIRGALPGMWRKTTPKGLKMKKFIEGPDGTLIQDISYVAEVAWEDDQEPRSQENMKQIIDKDVRINVEKVRANSEFNRVNKD